MTCSKCNSEMEYVETRYLPISPDIYEYVEGETFHQERCDIWRCPRCGPKSQALNTIEKLMDAA